MPEQDRRAVPRLNEDARTECYQKLRVCMKDEFGKFYRESPEYFLDARSKKNIERSISMLACMLTILDEYDIAARS